MRKYPARTGNLKQPKTVSVGAYIRVSTEEQAESGLGMEAQRTRIRGMCIVKDWPEPVFYVDDGISGTLPVSKRPGLKALMEDARDGKIDVVVISSLDRLGRRMVIVINLVEELCFNQQVTLVSCKESFDTSTPQGTFVMHIFVAMAQLEWGLISQRTREALTERQRRDGEHGGGIPFGYRRTEQGIAIDREAASVVRAVFLLKRRGLTLRQIGNEVGKAHTSVAEIINNRAIYRGGFRGASQARWPLILATRKDLAEDDDTSTIPALGD